MTEPIAIVSIFLGAVNALGTIYSIWRHCKSDIAHRALLDARLEALEKR